MVILIEENVFESKNPDVSAISARGVDGLIIRNNYYEMDRKTEQVQIIDSKDVDWGGITNFYYP